MARSELWIAALAAGLALTGAARAQTAEMARGADVYDDRCSGCHVLEGVGQGPSLRGVIGENQPKPISRKAVRILFESWNIEFYVHRFCYARPKRPNRVILCVSDFKGRRHDSYPQSNKQLSAQDKVSPLLCGLRLRGSVKNQK